MRLVALLAQQQSIMWNRLFLVATVSRSSRLLPKLHGDARGHSMDMYGKPFKLLFNLFLILGINIEFSISTIQF